MRNEIDDLTQLPEMVNIDHLCHLFGRSKRTIRRWRHMGLLPAPAIRRSDGGGTSWWRDELIAWKRAGSPDRRTWERIRHKWLPKE